MAKKALYRRSIWRDDSRYEFDYAARTKSERETLARLAWINAAKVTVAPIAPARLLAIHAGIKRMPSSGDVKIENVAEYLQQGLSSKGAGIPTLICMLAVEKGGKRAAEAPGMNSPC
jgi:hypothetical protein